MNPEDTDKAVISQRQARAGEAEALDCAGGGVPLESGGDGGACPVDGRIGSALHPSNSRDSF